MNKIYFVYIMASKRKVIYIGMTNNLIRRIYEHKNNLVEGFTKKYKCHSLIYYDSSSDIYEVIKREKQIKRWSRIKKLKLINEINPNWNDLYQDLFTY